MQWFQIKEQSAGKKRLIVSWYFYKIFGKNFVYFIAFMVSFFTFIFAPKVRGYSRKYLKVIAPYVKIKPNLMNEFSHVFSYACSLADKMFAYSGDFNYDDLTFYSVEDKKCMDEDIKKNKGAFFICSHVGNVEIMQFLLSKAKPNFDVNVFLSHAQSQIFNSFLNEIKQDVKVNYFFVEEIGPETGIALKESLDLGGIVFIAGDRLSENHMEQSVQSSLFLNKIFLPKGTFKLACLMRVPIYFISVLKIKNKYKIYLEKQETYNFDELVNSYSKFLEKMISIQPLQFYNFYDFFG